MSRVAGKRWCWSGATASLRATLLSCEYYSSTTATLASPACPCLMLCLYLVLARCLCHRAPTLRAKDTSQQVTMTSYEDTTASSGWWARSWMGNAECTRYPNSNQTPSSTVINFPTLLFLCSSCFHIRVFTDKLVMLLKSLVDSSARQGLYHCSVHS